MMTQNVAWRGGTFARCFNLARGLAELGHEVTILAAGSRRGLRKRISGEAGVRLIEMPGIMNERVRHAGLDPVEIVARLQYCAGVREVDIVQTFDHRPSVILPALFMQRKGRGLLISDWCDLWGGEGLASLRRGIERRLLGSFDAMLEERLHAKAVGLTVVSMLLLERARAEGWSGCFLLPPGADTVGITVGDKVEMRRKLDLPPDAPVVVYSGYTSNSIPLLADAFVSIAEQMPDARLLVIGSRFPELDTLLAQAGLRERIVFTRVVPQAELGSVLACGDVMMLPLVDHLVNVAGFPNKLGDYLAAGRPIVANAVGDAAAFIRAHDVGVVAGLDGDSLGDAAVQLMMDERGYQFMADRARATAEEHSWMVRAQTLEAFYREVLDG